MNRLCDEILQIIINELDDPTNFSLVNKSIYAFTREPYVRATYFMMRYGKVQALFWALGRGKLVNNAVVDILLSSGAHISRYLIQCVIQHYYRSLLPWIKTSWVRSLDFTVLNHLLALAGEKFGNIPVGKNDDDGAKFVSLLKESRIPPEQRTVKWDTVKEIVEKYQFIPFSNKDPMMASFPLVLAIEPRLLPYARVNGFFMDRKYRDFVFRKMFEKPVVNSEGRRNEIAANVRELSRLDRHMFLSRTVAAEICMEAKSNEPAYEALKILDKEGLLRFSLASVVEELIKLFVNTRSVTLPSVGLTLRHLYTDFPSKDPTVRVVLLLQLFIGILGGHSSIDIPSFIPSCKEKFDALGLSPIKRTDLLEVLANNFAPEHFGGILEFGRVVMKMARNEIEGLVQELAFRCLGSSFKGKMLKRLLESYPFLDDLVRERVMQHYRLNLDDLPAWDDEKAIRAYQAPLCRDFSMRFFGLNTLDVPVVPAQDRKDSDDDAMDQDATGETMEGVDDDDDLGNIGQDTLSTMIRKDELGPPRARRRFYDTYPSVMEHTAKLTYPSDYLHVGKYLRTRYGVRSGICAVFFMNAIANGSPSAIQNCPTLAETCTDARIPVTLKLFKILARLGRGTVSTLFEDIEAGAEFYFSEEDYLSPEELKGSPQKSSHLKRGKRPRYRIKMVQEYTVKTESSPDPSVLLPFQDAVPEEPLSSSSRARPRRSVASSKNYAVPDSDDEAIADVFDEKVQDVSIRAKKRKVESNMQKWIKHLTALMKEEEKRYKEKKKRVQASATDSKVRVMRSDFLRSITFYLQRLRKTDKLKRQQLYGFDVPDDDYSSGEEDEYQARTRKRRRVEVS
ncbi:hypothetical protein BXZ70DRAFT_596840 [Cristinia sonorae]|uniref:Uncharacterized protein n=1 Tax=Cristinia sonorae TaxID=1940300 RepID=A0A8K0UVP8_9AGAR|nr:hypothetical protein BXZ70DRAFT_596840 [Cristinia sonorae]